MCVERASLRKPPEKWGKRCPKMSTIASRTCTLVDFLPPPIFGFRTPPPPPYALPRICGNSINRKLSILAPVECDVTHRFAARGAQHRITGAERKVAKWKHVKIYLLRHLMGTSVNAGTLDGADTWWQLTVPR